jgi:hypothetical protein
MAYPVILHDNILRVTGVTITASSTESGYAAADLADLRPWKMWKSGTVVTGITIDIDTGAGGDNADTLGLINHNITSEGGTIEVKADGSNPPTTVRLAAYTPTYGDVELKTFTAPGAVRYWRITLAKGGNFANKPFIGELILGMRTTLPEYLDPGTDPFMRQTEAAVEMSEGGHVLGAVLRGQTHRMDLATSSVGMARSFWTSDLKAFDQNHLSRMRPFIFQIDGDDADFSKPYYLMKSPGGNVGRSAVNGVWSRLGFNGPVTEAWMETA